MLAGPSSCPIRAQPRLLNVIGLRRVELLDFEKDLSDAFDLTVGIKEMEN